ncbi:MAG TPA: CDP-alcohol phosphatidyltransferase family protein, partial [Rhizomicrobium sp.]
TLAAFAVGLGAVGAIAHGLYLWGAALILASRVLDGLDGEVARATTPTNRGAALDLILGFMLAAALPFGFALADPPRALAAMFLIFSLASQAVASLSLALISVRTGRGIGVTDKSAVHIAMLLACLLPDWFSIIAYVLGVVCFIAIGVRVASIRFRTP